MVAISQTIWLFCNPKLKTPAVKAKGFFLGFVLSWRKKASFGKPINVLFAYFFAIKAIARNTSTMQYSVSMQKQKVKH